MQMLRKIKLYSTIEGRIIAKRFKIKDNLINKTPSDI